MYRDISLAHSKNLYKPCPSTSDRLNTYLISSTKTAYFLTLCTTCLTVRIFLLVCSSSNLSATRIDSQKSSERVAAGLKGTLKNPNVSEEAKDRATERLKDMGVEDREPVKVAPKTKVNGMCFGVPPL